MLSSCPSCLAQVEHEDHLFEVSCETCGARFNPFLTLDTGPTAAPVSPGRPEEFGTFGESSAAFQEVRDFGETLGFVKGNEPPAPLMSSKKETPTANKIAIPLDEIAPAPLTFSTPSEETLISSGDSLQGYAVETYFAPISLLAALSSTADPLRGPTLTLFQQGAALGANALLGFRWSVLPDGKCLLSGIPVRVRPAQP